MVWVVAGVASLIVEWWCVVDAVVVAVPLVWIMAPSGISLLELGWTVRIGPLVKRWSLEASLLEPGLNE
jgi:hypothetical protein